MVATVRGSAVRVSGNVVWQFVAWQLKHDIVQGQED